jgi:hypothetical protein
MTARAVVRRTADAADELLLWLNSQRRNSPASSGDAGVSAPLDAVAAIAGTGPIDIPPTCDRLAASDAGGPVPVRPPPALGPPLGAEHAAVDETSAAWRLAHTDWLHHRLTVSGPADTISGFRAAASGTGIIPWRLDFDRMAEDFFLLLATPPPPQQRTLSLQGARVLAGQLCTAVANRQTAARALAERGRTWQDARSTGDAGLTPAKLRPLDLHALVPIPDDILHLGPDHPQARAWLWTHWGTTEPLRHVAESAAQVRRRQPGEEPRLEISFWSADWTPWQALAQAAARWPDLRFVTQPSYEDP